MFHLLFVKHSSSSPTHSFIFIPDFVLHLRKCLIYNCSIPSILQELLARITDYVFVFRDLMDCKSIVPNSFFFLFKLECWSKCKFFKVRVQRWFYDLQIYTPRNIQHDQHLNFKTNYHADVNDGHKITRTLILASTTILIYTLFFLLKTKIFSNLLYPHIHIVTEVTWSKNWNVILKSKNER